MTSGQWRARQGAARREAARRTLDESIIVALGGNLAAGETELQRTLTDALAGLSDVGLQVLRRSRFWKSAAWPDPSEPPFLNAVALVETALDPAQTLAALQEVERRFGRVRGLPNAARPLDLDLIAYGRRVCAGGLVLPHPRAKMRLFVMGPLAELAPDWRHPVTGECASDLAGRASVGLDAAPLPDSP